MARNIIRSRISGSVKWSIDDEGLMLFEPVNGVKGTLANTKKDYSGILARDWYNFSYQYIVSVKRIEATGKVYFPKKSTSMFFGFSSLTSIDFSHFDTSRVAKMNSMFGCCDSLTDIDFSSLKTSNVIDTCCMFRDCFSLTSLDLSNFDMSNVTDMRGMFDDCHSLSTLDLSGLKSLVGRNTDHIFHECNQLSNLTLSEDIEKTTNDFAFLATLFNYTYDWAGFNRRIQATGILLDYLEKFLGTDFSKEKERLKTATEEDMSGIAIWKAQSRPITNVTKALNVLKILAAHGVDQEELEKTNLQSLEKNGVVSDINAYLNGVPLADVLA